jgi:L-iditol 2-dehydrogenase
LHASWLIRKFLDVMNIFQQLTLSQATRPGGQLVMVGMGTPIQTLPMSASHLKEVDIIGIFRYANTYPTGIKLISAGVLPSLDNMITHR